MQEREDALGAIMISLILFIIEVQLVCKAHTIELRSSISIWTIQHRKSNTICHAHCPNAPSIAAIPMDWISGNILGLMFLVTILVVGLVCSDFFQDSLQTTLCHMNFALIFSFFLLPIVLVPGPLLVDTVRVLFLASNLLLGSLQTPFDFGVEINSFVTFSREF
jgi:hypothetical protein